MQNVVSKYKLVTLRNKEDRIMPVPFGVLYFEQYLETSCVFLIDLPFQHQYGDRHIMPEHNK